MSLDLSAALTVHFSQRQIMKLMFLKVQLLSYIFQLYTVRAGLESVGCNLKHFLQNLWLTVKVMLGTATYIFSYLSLKCFKRNKSLHGPIIN